MLKCPFLLSLWNTSCSVEFAFYDNGLPARREGIFKSLKAKNLPCVEFTETADPKKTLVFKQVTSKSKVKFVFKEVTDVQIKVKKKVYITVPFPLWQRNDPPKTSDLLERSKKNGICIMWQG